MPRVATKYVESARRFFAGKGMQVELIHISGSVELAPLLGLAHWIVDLVQTGRTLAENGLVVVEEISRSSARLIVNRASHKLRLEEHQRLIADLAAALEARSGCVSAKVVPKEVRRDAAARANRGAECGVTRGAAGAGLALRNPADECAAHRCPPRVTRDGRQSIPQSRRGIRWGRGRPPSRGTSERPVGGEGLDLARDDLVRPTF